MCIAKGAILLRHKAVSPEWRKALSTRRAGSPHEDAVVVDHLDELNVGWRMIYLDNIKRVGGADVPRTWLQAAQVFAAGKPSTCDLLGGENQRDPLGDGDIGRRLEPFTGAERADLVDDRREIGLFRPEPHFPQCRSNDGFDLGGDPRVPRSVRPGQ